MPDRAGGDVSAANTGQIKAKYTSISVGTVGAILRENLELSEGTAEEGAVLALLLNSQTTLGRGNFASYLAGDDAPGATKTRKLAEIFKLGCWYGMEKSSVAGRYLPTIHAGNLGPFSLPDFRPLYLGFLGRDPSASEVRELTFLVTGVLRNAEGTSDTSEIKARRVRAAVCTAVLSTLESTRGR